MPNPEPFRLRVSPSVANDAENNENWRRVYDWDQRLAPTGMTLIARVAIANTNAPTNRVTFSNIPQNFHHLQLVNNVACSGAAGTRYNSTMQLNNDTSVNYSWQLVGSISGGAVGVFVNSATTVTIGNHPGTTAGRSALVRVLIPDYSMSTSLGTPFNHQGLVENNCWDTNSWCTFAGGFVHPTTVPLTRIDLFTDTGNWIAPSTFCLYGIY